MNEDPAWLSVGSQWRSSQPNLKNKNDEELHLNLKKAGLASLNIVLNISRCVSLAVVFDSSSFLFFSFPKRPKIIPKFTQNRQTVVMVTSIEIYRCLKRERDSIGRKAVCNWFWESSLEIELSTDLRYNYIRSPVQTPANVKLPCVKLKFLKGFCWFSFR